MALPAFRKNTCDQWRKTFVNAGVVMDENFTALWANSYKEAGNLVAVCATAPRWSRPFALIQGIFFPVAVIHVLRLSRWRHFHALFPYFKIVHVMRHVISFRRKQYQCDVGKANILLNLIKRCCYRDKSGRIRGMFNAIRPMNNGELCVTRW